MKHILAVIGMLAAFPAVASDVPVEQINDLLKGHIWTFPVDGRETSVYFKEFRHQHGNEYAIVVEVH